MPLLLRQRWTLSPRLPMPAVSSAATAVCCPTTTRPTMRIDRTDQDARTVLLRLARCQVAATPPQDVIETNGDWHAALANWRLPAPDGAPLTVEGTVLPLAWRTRLAAAS